MYPHPSVYDEVSTGSVMAPQSSPSHPERAPHTTVDALYIVLNHGCWYDGLEEGRHDIVGTGLILENVGRARTA